MFSYENSGIVIFKGADQTVERKGSPFRGGQ